jgi:hypothetical protein
LATVVGGVWHIYTPIREHLRDLRFFVRSFFLASDFHMK